MPLEMWLKITDKKTGHVDYYEKSKSFTMQFIQLLNVLFSFAYCAAAGYLSPSTRSGTNTEPYPDNIVDTGGVNRTAITSNSYYSRMNTSAPAGTVTHGIVVGMSDQVEDFADFKLVDPCAHGVGLGEFMHGQMVYVQPTNASGTVSFSQSRVISNGSGNSIIVKEVGIYAWQSGQAAYYFCIIRDVLGAPVTIVDGDDKIVEYILQTVN